MRINTNVAALNSYNQLKNTQNNLSKSLSRLSSGKRINGAADDAAGLAISEKMKSQTRGLGQAQRNAQDGISMIQTAEGALKETHSILQRMRELSVQAANDTNTTEDRAEIQKEINQLTDEVNRIGNTTEFNTKKLLNGGAGLGVKFSAETVTSVKTDSADWISVTGGSSDTTADNVQISVTGADAAAAATDSTITTDLTDASAHSFTLNGKTINYTSGGDVATSGENIAAAINNFSDELGITASDDGAGNITLTTDSVGSNANIDWDAASGEVVGSSVVDVDVNGSDADINSLEITDADYVSSGNNISVVSGKYKGLELNLNSEVMSGTTNNNLADFKIESNGTVGMQIGANEGQSMSVSVNDMRSEALGIHALDVSNAENANKAISTLDDAIANVSSERSKLGAVQNRLDHTINNLNTSQENLTAAESRISDVDMAKEMMNMSKNQILSQAGTAMLAQANQLPQGVLQLLG